jgi:hypothetical protein
MIINAKMSKEEAQKILLDELIKLEILEKAYPYENESFYDPYNWIQRIYEINRDIMRYPTNICRVLRELKNIPKEMILKRLES